MSRRGAAGLGLASAAALVVANTIGAGVFSTSGFLLGDLHSPGRVLGAWAVGAVIALCGALCYGALARRIPESGGEYVLLSRQGHPLFGFLSGWVSLLAGFTAPIAVSALALGTYLAPLLGDEVPARVPAAGVIVLAALLHATRRAGGVLLQDLAVLVKLLLVAAFVVGAAGELPRTPLLPDAGPFDAGAFGAALVWISFCYSGWNAAIYVAGEVRDPVRNVPRALLLGTAVVALVSLALNAVFVLSAPPAELAGRADVGALAARALGGERAEFLVRLAVPLALWTSVSSMVMAGPRVYAAMARDGFLPRVLAARPDAHGISSVPPATVVFQAVLALLAISISELPDLLLYAGFTLGLSAAGTVLGLLRLRAREGRDAVPIVGHPFVPWLFVVATSLTTLAVVRREPLHAALGLATLGAGLPAWWLRGRRARRSLTR